VSCFKWWAFAELFKTFSVTKLASSSRSQTPPLVSVLTRIQRTLSYSFPLISISSSGFSLADKIFYAFFFTTYLLHDTSISILMMTTMMTMMMIIILLFLLSLPSIVLISL
jgi:hypothetical protein